jgi:prepilin-type N-terminal cleavage/methylation domain-containing protein
LSPRQAFTLVETLAALALAAILALATQRLVVNTYRQTAALQRRLDTEAVQALPLELLVQDLQNRPAGGGLELKDGVLTFGTLNALNSPGPALRHAAIVTYQTQADSGGALRLVRREHAPGQNAAGPRWVLLAGIRKLDWAVFDGQRWQTVWPLTIPRSARALRVELIHADGRTSARTIRLQPLRWVGHD